MSTESATLERYCTDCHEEKPQTTEHFYWYEYRGWFNRCKPCTAARQAAKRAEKRAETPRNPPKPRPSLTDEAGNAWCTGHEAWHPVGEFAKNRAARHGLQYRCKAWEAAYKRQQLQDPVKLERQRERIRNADRNRRAAHWAVTPLSSGYRRVRRAGGYAEKITPEALLAHWADYGVSEHECWVCGDAWEHGADGHLDHVVPVAGGGSHVPANLRPLCRSCSRSKEALPLMRWVQADPHRFTRFIWLRSAELNRHQRERQAA